MGIKAVVFDVDGTLYSNTKMYLRSALFALGNLSLLKAFTKTRKELRNLHNIDDFYSIQAALVGQKLGLSKDDAYALIQDKIYTEWEACLKGIKPYPYVRECVTTLRMSGLKTGLISDFPLGNKIEYLGLEGLWDEAFTTEAIGKLKPDRASFDLMAEKLNCRLNEIIYVGNSYSYDIIGAKNAGMLAAHLGRKKGSIADLSFRRYKTLTKWVLQRL